MRAKIRKMKLFKVQQLTDKHRLCDTSQPFHLKSLRVLADQCYTDAVQRNL